MTPQNVSMSKKPRTIVKNPEFDWYFKEWCQALEIIHPHAWLQREVGYSDGKASNVLTGVKRYDREILNAVSKAMKIHPFELLMHPADANAYRKQKEAAFELVKQAPSEPEAPLNVKRVTG